MRSQEADKLYLEPRPELEINILVGQIITTGTAHNSLELLMREGYRVQRRHLILKLNQKDVWCIVSQSHHKTDKITANLSCPLVLVATK